VTEEFHPGFRNSVASYAVSLLHPKIIRDLDLANNGLRIVERKLSNFLPTDDGRYLMVGNDQTSDEVANALLHHSDRGSQYTSEQFQRLMADHGVRTSPVPCAF
jgi:phytoene dehydrogenase-like protein